MARLLGKYERPTSNYEIGDDVYFYLGHGGRVYGHITRVYNHRDLYHVTTSDADVYEVDGRDDGLHHNGTPERDAVYGKKEIT